MERVITESQSSKGAFFHHFPAKNELAKALGHRYVAADLEYLDDAVKHMRTRHADPVHRILAFIEVFEHSVLEMVSAQSSCH